MKRSTRILALLLCALLLLSGCAAEEASAGTETFSAAEPTPSPTPEPSPSPAPVPTPAPTAEPVMHAETEVSGEATYILPGQTDATVLLCWSGAHYREGMRVLYGVAGEDDALPAEPTVVEPTESALGEALCSADKSQYVAELAVEPATRYAYAVVKNGEEPDAVYHFRTNDAGELHTAAVSDTHL